MLEVGDSDVDEISDEECSIPRKRRNRKRKNCIGSDNEDSEALGQPEFLDIPKTSTPNPDIVNYEDDSVDGEGRYCE